jgi:hypothetical protein
MAAPMANPTCSLNKEPPNNSGLWSPKFSNGLMWQWQLQGTLDTLLNVDMYDIDLFDTSATTIQQLKAAGHTIICYFLAGTYKGWRDDWEANFDFITGGTYSGSEPPFAGNMANWDKCWLNI